MMALIKLWTCWNIAAEKKKKKKGVAACIMADQIDENSQI
jgi:hypothetical protein